jgi:hypothetical protein
LHHVLIPPFFYHFPIFLSGYLESFRLRSSSGVAHCPFSLPIFFPLTHLDIPLAQAALYTTPYLHPQSTSHHIPALHILPIGPHFSDEHGLFICLYLLLTLYIVLILLLLSITYRPLSVSLSLSLSLISHSLISLTLSFSLVIVDRGSNISFTHYFHVPFYLYFFGLCLD